MSQEISRERSRFELLDALRGIAAIAVMIFHYTQHNGLHWVRGAWAAVDLFFILSGFVIAHSYGKKLKSGMSLKEFMVARFVRLGPLYYFGLILGIVAALLSSGSGVSLYHIFMAALLGVIWLPYFNDVSWPFANDRITSPAFPLNDPAWSLFFEMFVNVAFAFFAAKINKPRYILPLVLFATTYIASILIFNQSNPGWSKDSFIFGFPRVLLQFFLGVFIYHLAPHKNRSLRGVVILIGGAAFVLAFSGRGALFSSLTIIPLLVFFSAGVKIQSHSIRKACEALGVISYPLYIIHFPVFRIFSNIPAFSSASPMAQVLFATASCLLMAYMLSILDQRIRKSIAALENKKAPDGAI